MQKLTSGLQQQAGRPLFIAVDQEGGAVARLEGDFTEFPGNAALARCKNPHLAYEAALASGREMKSVGVNFNLAPVVDVNNNPRNPVIGIRSFSDNPEEVTEWGRKSLEGYQNAGIVACLKHFPGHGDVTVDSHFEQSSVSKSLSQLKKCELYPFAHLVKEAPAIMTAHIVFPQIDPNHCATLSSLLINGLLREQLQFQGVIVTDSLTMNGVLKEGGTLEQVVLKAIDAGNDLLLIGGRDLQRKIKGEAHVDEVIRVIQHVVKAIRTGVIDEERIDASVRRILQLKERYDHHDFPYSERRSELWKIAQEIAYRSLSIQEWGLHDEITSEQLLVVAPQHIIAKVRNSDLCSAGKSVELYFTADFEPTPKEQSEILQLAQSKDRIIVCAYQAWKYPKQQKLLKKLTEVKPTICIAVRDAQDLELFPKAMVKMATYSPTTCALNVAAAWLKGETVPFEISDAEAGRIGRKIWFNECKLREDQLTFWHEKEPFPSMGIGHFIWPPANYSGPFTERFHKFILFAESQGVKVPAWLIGQIYCPWENREVFYREFNSLKMQELRQFLIDSVSTQARYMVERLNRAFSQMVLSARVDQRQKIVNNFFEVGNLPEGIYILIDYLNFKHEGTDPKERYLGQGWGLLQVLEEMDLSRAIDSPSKEFAQAAKLVLTRRVANSPKQEIEKGWLPGWMNRITTYERP